MAENKVIPPFVCYEIRAVEDRAASIQAGHFVARDIDYVIVMQRGGTDKTERPYADWITLQKQLASEGRIPEDWVEKYEAGYARWKRSEEIPEEGTPIKTWPVPSPAQVKMLVGMGITTVEQLAACTTEAIKRLGMGGLTLKQQANDFLDAAKDSGKLVKELAATRSNLANALEQLETLTQQVATLKAQRDVTASAVSGTDNSPPPAQFQL